MYHFFLHTSEIGISCTLPVRKTKPNPLHADSWRSMVHIALWRLLTWLRSGNYWMYELLKDGKPVSFAEVCTEHWQLPFMNIRMGAKSTTISDPVLRYQPSADMDIIRCC